MYVVHCSVHTIKRRLHVRCILCYGLRTINYDKSYEMYSDCRTLYDLKCAMGTYICTLNNVHHSLYAVRYTIQSNAIYNVQCTVRDIHMHICILSYRTKRLAFCIAYYSIGLYTSSYTYFLYTNSVTAIPVY